ncbi:hypothetical protein ILUMI_04792 [Ignelater luminosus]|uniref:RING-type E3 ubiquitin transferase n=1 Tax=Ignelater luminosus TaxID=2038154 RepID=A0A8K0GIQ2_IGNLU|nr:hypothetical protein ILUMI_04792 [Ignelater luminosus]
MLEILEKITALEFNDRIASLPVFLCQRCLKLLKNPIMLLKDVGNICGNCTSPEDSKTATPNSALELIIQNLVFSCSNAERGCKEKSSCSNMLIHNSVCNYRDYACPGKLFTDCNWKGRFSDLIVHTETRHGQHAIEGYNNSFKFYLNLFDNREVIRLLYTDDEYFVLRIKCNTEAKVVHYIMYYLQLKDNKNDSSILYTISQTYKSITRSASNTTLSYENDYTQYYYTKNAVRINLPKVLNNLEPITVRLLLNNSEEPNDKLLEFLDCNVCNNLMKPPIYQCLTGHSICSSCVEKLDLCPLCKSAYSGTRNFTLESLCENIKVSCAYREYGCFKLSPVTEIEQHKRTCLSRPYPCPISIECLPLCAFSEIEKHMQISHTEKLIYNNYTEKRSRCPTDLTDMFCMVAHGRIFRVTHKQDKGTEKAYWIVQIISLTNEEKQYKYEIGLINSTNGIQTHIKSDICQSLFRNFIIFSFNDISLFSSKDEFTYYCKISKLT